MNCPVRKKPRQEKNDQPPAAIPAGPKKAAAGSAARPKVRRNELEEACERLDLLTFEDVRWKLAEILGKPKKVSRQHIYNLINRHELVQGISLANVATITKASWLPYVKRLEATRS